MEDCWAAEVTSVERLSTGSDSGGGGLVVGWGLEMEDGDVGWEPEIVVDGVEEVDGIEVDGVEFDGAEVGGMEVDGVEVDEAVDFVVVVVVVE